MRKKLSVQLRESASIEERLLKRPKAGCSFCEYRYVTPMFCFTESSPLKRTFSASREDSHAADLMEPILARLPAEAVSCIHRQM